MKLARVRRWADLIEAHGGEVATIEQGNHLKFKLVTGPTFVVAKTPTDHRADLNALAQLKRLLDWQPAPRKPQEARPARTRSFGAKSEPEAAQPRPLRIYEPHQRVRNQERRERLGLDGSRVPKPVLVAKPERPVLSLARSQERGDGDQAGQGSDAGTRA